LNVLRQLKYLSGVEWSALLFALVFSHLVLFYNISDAFYWDEISYIDGANGIFKNGLISCYPYSHVRTYVYPTFLAIIKSFSNFFLANIYISRISIFYAQLILYLLSLFWIRHTLREKYINENIGSWCFCLLCLNIFNLAYLSFALTEILSLMCILIILIKLIVFLPYKFQFSRDIIKNMFVLGFLSASAILIRPANITIIMTIIFLLGCKHTILKGKIPKSILLIFCIGFLLPFLPQFINNVVFYKAYTPMLVANLGLAQLGGGLQYLKYATSIIPDSVAQIYYLNPFWPMDTAHNFSAFFQALISHPKVWIFTPLLHIFNLLDQDYIFPFIKDLMPWYRWLLTILVHSIVSFGILGLFIALYLLLNKRYNRQYSSDKYFWLLMVTIIFLACYVGLYSLVAVESRFGLPVITIISFFIPVTLRAFKSNILSATVKYLIGTGLVFYVVLAFSLSRWIAKQALLIRELF